MVSFEPRSVSGVKRSAGDRGGTRVSKGGRIGHWSMGEGGKKKANGHYTLGRERKGRTVVAVGGLNALNDVSAEVGGDLERGVNVLVDLFARLEWWRWGRVPGGEGSGRGGGEGGGSEAVEDGAGLDVCRYECVRVRSWDLGGGGRSA